MSTKKGEVTVHLPDASLHNPDPEYLRQLLDAAGLSQRNAAKLIGMTYEGFRNYVKPTDHPLYRVAPYTVQYLLEVLAADKSSTLKT